MAGLEKRIFSQMLKTTLIGCGAVAQKLYLKPLQKLERLGLLQVAHLIDSHARHAETMKAAFSRAVVHEDLEKALALRDSELALVLTPTQFHHAHAILALRHGNHVLCEKPLAINEAHCAEIVQVARSESRVLAVGMVRRFFPSFARLKTHLDRGDLGTIQSFEYREGHVFDWDVKTPAGFLKKADGGGGILFDIGSHAIDFLISLFGDPRLESYADDALRGVEGNVVMRLSFPSCSGTVQLSWDSPLKSELRVVGSRGEALLRLDQVDKLAIKTAGTFSDVAVDHGFPSDLSLPPARLVPRLYT